MGVHEHDSRAGIANVIDCRRIGVRAAFHAQYKASGDSSDRGHPTGNPARSNGEQLLQTEGLNPTAIPLPLQQYYVPMKHRTP